LSPRATRGTEPALLAAERDELLGVAPLTAHAQEALLRPAALQVDLELLLHMARQRPSGLCTQLAKAGVVLLDKLVQQRRLGPVARVTGRIEERRRTRSPRTGSDGHVGRPVDGWGRNRLRGEPPRPTTQTGSLRAEIPVGAPAARGNRDDLTRPQRKRPGSRLPGLVHRAVTPRGITCPCRPCRSCPACRHRACGRHPSGPRRPSLPSSAAGPPPRRRSAARDG